MFLVKCICLVLDLTQHADSQHEGVHPVRHHSGAAPGWARRRHHLLGLGFLTLDLRHRRPPFINKFGRKINTQHDYVTSAEHTSEIYSLKGFYFCCCDMRTILLLISWKWISHTFSTTSSFSKVTKPKPGRHTNRLFFQHLTSLIVTSPEEAVFLPCVIVCWLVCQQDQTKTTERISVKIPFTFDAESDKETESVGL